MSSKEDQLIASYNPREIGSAIVLSAGLAVLALGEAIFLLAALLLPAAVVDNDTIFFGYGLLGMASVFVGALLVSGGLIGLKWVNWLAVLGVLLVAVFATYGFRWPEWLLPSVANPLSPFIGQFSLGGIMLVLFLVALLRRGSRAWPVLWRPLLVSAVVTAIAIALLVWLYLRIP